MIKLVLCDDSKQYLELLESKLSTILNKKNIKYSITTTDNLTDLKKAIKKNEIDIAYIDVVIDGINSISWTLDNISENLQFVFMTEYPEEAYRISEIDNSFLFVKNKATEELLQIITNKAISRTYKDSDTTIVRSGNTNITIKIEDIIYIESMDNYILLNMRSGRKIKVYQKLKDFKEKLGDNFQSTHKSYIVNMDYIISYHPYEFILNNEAVIPIAQKRFKTVITTYKNYI